MKRLLLLILVTAWTLTYAPGCGGAKTEAEAASPKPETTLSAPGEICETLPEPESTIAAATPEPTPAKTETEPKPEPKPEPPPKPKALPRMWDFGSTNCLPCKEMEKILHPLMQEYAGKVDVRIINVYEDQEMSRQARIQIIPTQIFYDPSGKELYRHVGVYPRDSIVGKFKEFGWE